MYHYLYIAFSNMSIYTRPLYILHLTRWGHFLYKKYPSAYPSRDFRKIIVQCIMALSLNSLWPLRRKGTSRWETHPTMGKIPGIHEGQRWTRPCWKMSFSFPVGWCWTGSMWKNSRVSFMNVFEKRYRGRNLQFGWCFFIVLCIQRVMQVWSMKSSMHQQYHQYWRSLVTDFTPLSLYVSP